MQKSEEKDNILFLDFDGVINIKGNHGLHSIQSDEAVYYINKLCLETGFKIVVSSSWKELINYKEFLYSIGIDKNIDIVGKTECYKYGKEYEILKYLKDHKIEKYIIIDDASFSNDFAPHHIQTAARLGFTKNKYEEALIKINNLDNLSQ